jgi:hypothetical protein
VTIYVDVFHLDVLGAGMDRMDTVVTIFFWMQYLSESDCHESFISGLRSSEKSSMEHVIFCRSKTGNEEKIERPNFTILSRHYTIGSS